MALRIDWCTSTAHPSIHPFEDFFLFWLYSHEFFCNSSDFAFSDVDVRTGREKE